MSAARSNYQTWLAKAEHDLLNIENNLQAPEIPWDTIREMIAAAHRIRADVLACLP